MGRKSTKENKNIYHTSREKLGYSREDAAEKLAFISAARIEKIENEKTLPRPDEVLAMAECYQNPSLCNYYCSHECPIGHKYVPEIESKELSQITLEMLATLNTLTKEKDRIIEIAMDGQITEDEIPDFVAIREKLDKLALTIDSLNLWVNNAILTGKVDKSFLEN